VLAPLPKEAASHFGPNLKRFVLSQYHQGQVTVPRLAALLIDPAHKYLDYFCKSA